MMIHLKNQLSWYRKTLLAISLSVLTTSTFAKMSLDNAVMDNTIFDNKAKETSTKSVAVVMPTSILSQSSLQQLSQTLGNDIQWQRLLVFNPNKNQSGVLNKAFFTSPMGRNDSQAELMAGLQALNTADSAKDYLCRFPARSHWLMQQIPSLQAQLHAMLGTTSCKQVDDWLKMVDARQLSLIHAEEHVNRIGSSTGHTLMRIDNSKSLASKQTDDAYFLNFATDEQIAEEQGIKAKLNAMRGRGVGTMTFGQYTAKQANYLLNDQRDIWQYKLDLPQESINQIMRHLWEIKSAHRYYNFLNYNCASEVLRLLDVVDTNNNFVAEAGKVIAPAEVSRLLNEYGLIKAQQFVPSQRTVRQANINAGMAQITTEAYTNLAQQGQLPVFTPSNNNPLNASQIHRVKVGIKHHAQTDSNRYMIGIRGAYQDLLDSSVGKRNYLNATMMSLDLGYTDTLDGNQDEQTVRVEEAILYEGLRLNPKNSTDPSASLGGHIKVTSVVDASDMANETHRVASIGAEYGSSWLVGKGKSNTGEMANTLCYALGNATGQAGHLNKGYRVGVGVHAGCVHHINEQLRVLVDANLPYWYQGSRDDSTKVASKNVAGNEDSDFRSHYLQPSIRLAGQYDFGNHTAIRGSIEQQKNYDSHDTTYGVSYHWFFD